MFLSMPLPVIPPENLSPSEPTPQSQNTTCLLPAASSGAMPSARRRTWVDVSDSGDCQVPSEQMMMFFMIPPVLGVNWSSFFGGYHALLSAPVSWGPPAPQPTYRTWQSPYPPHSRNHPAPYPDNYPAASARG